MCSNSVNRKTENRQQSAADSTLIRWIPEKGTNGSSQTVAGLPIAGRAEMGISLLFIRR